MKRSVSPNNGHTTRWFLIALLLSVSTITAVITQLWFVAQLPANEKRIRIKTWGWVVIMTLIFSAISGYITERWLINQIPKEDSLISVMVKKRDIKFRQYETKLIFEVGDSSRVFSLKGEWKNAFDRDYFKNKQDFANDSFRLLYSPLAPDDLIALQTIDKTFFGYNDYWQYRVDVIQNVTIAWYGCSIVLLVVFIFITISNLVSAVLHNKMRMSILSHKHAWEIEENEYKIKIEDFLVYIDHEFEYALNGTYSNCLSIYIQVPSDIVQNHWVKLRTTFPTEVDEGITYVLFSHTALFRFDFQPAYVKIMEEIKALKALRLSAEVE